MHARRPDYLQRLQLGGLLAASGGGVGLWGVPASAASAAAIGAHQQLLQALGGHKDATPAVPSPSGLAGSSISPGGLAAPRAVRPPESRALMQLADLAMALRMQVHHSAITQPIYWQKTRRCMWLSCYPLHSSAARTALGSSQASYGMCRHQRRCQAPLGSRPSVSQRSTAGATTVATAAAAVAAAPPAGQPACDGRAATGYAGAAVARCRWRSRCVPVCTRWCPKTDC
jgi:hypothetical protein